MKKINTLLTGQIYKQLQKEFGYAAIGYYYEILKQLQKQDNYLYKLNKLNKLARDTKIRRKILERFIEACTCIFNKKGVPLLSKNQKYFWSEEILNKYLYTDKNNFSLKGRKKVSIQESIKLPNAESVNLTQYQYEKLIKKFGRTFTENAIGILNEWLRQKTKQSEKYLNKNNYGHFRSDSWVITQTAKFSESIESQPIYAPDCILKVSKVL